jgi:nicotinate-nucleotide adenylyltransferase
VARAARTALGLDTVLFAPVGAQPLKPAGSTAGFDERVAMTRLAIAEDPGFVISLVDAPKATGKPNYTLDTLEELKRGLLPGCGLYCLMGADSFVGLQRWHRAAEIPFVAPLIVASRPGQRLDGLRASLPAGLTMEAAAASDFSEGSGIEIQCYSLVNQAGQQAPFYLLPDLDVEISASEIREGRGRGDSIGHPIRELLPEAVWEYIQAHNLYR